MQFRAPVRIRNSLTLSHQKENNRKDTVPAALLSSSPHLLSPSPCPWLHSNWRSAAHCLPVLIHGCHISSKILTKPPKIYKISRTPKSFKKCTSYHSHQNISQKFLNAFLLRHKYPPDNHQQPNKRQGKWAGGVPEVQEPRAAERTLSLGLLFHLGTVLSSLLDGVPSMTRQSQQSTWPLKASSSSQIPWQSVLP